MKKLTSTLVVLALALSLTLLLFFLFAGEAKAAEFRVDNFETFSSSFKTFNSGDNCFDSFQFEAGEFVIATHFDRDSFAAKEFTAQSFNREFDRSTMFENSEFQASTFGVDFKNDFAVAFDKFESAGFENFDTAAFDREFQV